MRITICDSEFSPLETTLCWLCHEMPAVKTFIADIQYRKDEFGDKKLVHVCYQCMMDEIL